MLTDLLKFITETTQKTVRQTTSVIITIILLYLAAPDAVLFAATTLQYYMNKVIDFIIPFLRLEPQSVGTISSIIVLCVLWIGIQLLVIVHDNLLILLNSLLPRTTVSIVETGAMLRSSDRWMKIAYKYYRDNMSYTDFCDLYSIYLSKVSLSDDVRKIVNSWQSGNNIAFLRERIVISRLCCRLGLFIGT